MPAARSSGPAVVAPRTTRSSQPLRCRSRMTGMSIFAWPPPYVTKSARGTDDILASRAASRSLDVVAGGSPSDAFQGPRRAEIMRVLVVGLGSMGKRRVRDLVRLEAGPVAGFDPREDRGTEARERYGIDVYTDFDEALTRHEPDAVVVSTPPDRHKEYALASVSRGLHTCTELNLDPSVVDALIAAHRGPGIVIAPSATMRLHPAIVRMRSLLEGRAFGPALLFTYHTGQWLPDWHPWEDYRDFFASRAATGACREIIAIELSWLVWLFGPVDAVRVRARRGARRPSGPHGDRRECRRGSARPYRAPLRARLIRVTGAVTPAPRGAS